MDEDEAAEIARLRERAYGRTPDIAGDADAIRRLRELEARAAPREAAEPPAPPVADPAPAAEEEGDGPAAPAVPRRRLPRWAVAAGAIVAAAALVTATALITTAVPDAAPRYPSAAKVATLSVIDGGSAQEQASAGRRYADFRGFSVFAFTATAEDRPDVECLSIVSPEEAADDSLSTCGAAPFPVSVTTVISERSPAAARATYPTGTTLNFTLTTSGVEVWVAER